VSKIREFIGRSKAKGKEAYEDRLAALAEGIAKAENVPTLVTPLRKALLRASEAAEKKRFGDAQAALDEVQQLAGMADNLPSDPMKGVAVIQRLNQAWAPTKGLPVIEPGLAQLKAAADADLKAGKLDDVDGQLKFLADRVQETVEDYRRYTQTYAAADGHLTTLAAAGAPEVTALRDELAAAARQAEVGDYNGAEMFVSSVRDAAEELAGQYPGRTDAAAYQAAKQKLTPRYQDAVAKATPIPSLAVPLAAMTAAYNALPAALAGPLPAATQLLDDLLAKTVAVERGIQDTEIREAGVRSSLDGLRSRTDKATPPMAGYSAHAQQAVTDRLASIDAHLTNRRVGQAEAEVVTLRSELDTMDVAIRDEKEHVFNFNKVKNGVVDRALQMELNPGGLAANRTAGLNRVKAEIERWAALGQYKEAGRRIDLWKEQAEGWLESGPQAAEAYNSLENDDPVDTKKLKALTKKPGGTKIFDDLILSLGDDAPRGKVKAAMEVRFGIKVDMKKYVPKRDNTGAMELDSDGDPVYEKVADPLTGGSKSAKKLYEMMTQVPEKYVAHSKSFKNLKRVGGSEVDDTGAKTGESKTGGSYYSPGKRKAVVLKCGRGRDTDGTTIGEKANTPQDRVFPPDMEDLYKPVGGDNQDMSYFSWTTLHEIGHAVDDKAKFMDKNGSQAAHGGWTTHGGKIDAIAAAIQNDARFKAGGTAYDLGYIKKLLKAKAGVHPDAGEIPDVPNGVNAGDWANARTAIEAWVDAVRSTKDPWEKQSIAETATISGRVYHEGYPGDWYSYDPAARSKGISGYQFRAPGEWFAEMYAAFYSGKLKPGHPFAAVVDRLQ
jgi:hypothetical protein